MKTGYKPILAPRTTCTGCMACVDTCQFNALSGLIAKDGHLYPYYDSEKCTGCGLCTKICPVINGFRYGANKSDNSEPYAAWNKDECSRLASSSGGVFSALATHIIAGGGYVAGAVTDGKNITHTLTNDLNELKRQQGTKYQQGNLAGIHRQTLDKLRRGKTVLFSGTGCQIGGLLSFLNGRSTENLITVDLICGGFPSEIPMQKFLENERPQIASVDSFRDKDSGWVSRGFRYRLRVTRTDGTRADYGSENLPIGAFSSHLLSRCSCMDCRFAFASRKSDITIGDLWGDTANADQHLAGLSLAVTHSETGKSLLNEAGVEVRPVHWENFLPYNPRMVYGRYPLLEYHPGWIYRQRFIENLPYDSLKQAYNGAPATGIWKIYRTAGKMFYRMSRIKTGWEIKKILEKLK